MADGKRKCGWRKETCQKSAEKEFKEQKLTLNITCWQTKMKISSRGRMHQLGTKRTKLHSPCIHTQIWCHWLTMHLLLHPNDNPWAPFFFGIVVAKLPRRPLWSIYCRKRWIRHENSINGKLTKQQILVFLQILGFWQVKNTSICTFTADHYVNIMMSLETWLHSVRDYAKPRDLVPPLYSVSSFVHNTWVGQEVVPLIWEDCFKDYIQDCLMKNCSVHLDNLYLSYIWSFYFECKLLMTIDRIEFMLTCDLPVRKMVLCGKTLRCHSH